MRDTKQLWQSQNFLRSPEFVAGLVDRTAIGPRDVVVEIGPGKGIITQQLAKKAKEIIAIEIDPKLAKQTGGSFAENPKVQIVEADFLRWDLPEKPYKVFSNIPFNMTADIVNKLLTPLNAPEAAYLIMQDRAAERFMGEPVGTNSQMSILLQPFWNMGIIAKIDRNQFQPVPNINAVLAKFEKRSKPLVDPELTQQYRDFVIFGFNQWQPTILDAFRDIFSAKQVKIITGKLGIAGLKPSELTIEQWVGLFEAFQQRVPAGKKSIVEGAERKLRSKQKEMKKQHKTRRR